MADKDRAGAAALGAGAAALLTYFLTAGRAQAGMPPSGNVIFTPDEDTWNLLLGILEGTVEQNAKLENIETAISNLAAAFGVGVTLANPKRFGTGQVFPAIVGTAIRLPPRDIPWDKQVVVKALSTNGGIIQVGNSRVEAENSTACYPLLRSEGVGYKVQNSQEVWICLTVAGDGIAWTVEQE